MTREEMNRILKHVDHTVLSRTATWREIERCLEDALRFGTASACIPPSYVEAALRWRKTDPSRSKLKICTVIAFPNGYSSSAAKFAEARDALTKGADEIDMVINLGWVKDKNWEAIRNELHAIREVSRKHVFKVIIETSDLEQAEKIKLCELVAESGADYIKTSTGFSSGGASLADVELMRAESPAKLKIKASGGIRNFEEAAAMLAAGADRLGTSRLVSLMKERGGERQ